MGSQSSKLSPAQLSDLKNSTVFTSNEIQDWYERFYKDYPSGKMNKEELTKMYQQLFPSGDSTLFAEHIFQAYDVDGNGSIEFREFLWTVSVSARGAIDEKLKWAFQLYDIDKNGYVTKEEVLDIFKAVYKMKGYVDLSDQTAVAGPEETMEKLFRNLDKNRDSKLSMTEFVLGAKQAPEIIGLLQPEPAAK